MMLPHRLYKGQANTDDMFIRLLASIIYTGIAPFSFYTPREDGGRNSGHYDGIPVDVVAAAVVGPGDSQPGYCTYNMQNYHWDDGCSLDTFVDWIEAAGYSINRVADYQSWFIELKQKLSQLPEPQQRHSALEIADAYAVPQATDNPAVNCDQFKALVARLTVGPQVPHLSQDYIAKCLRDMCLLGLITPVTGF
jgi:fatty acid CoA ligase FadD9